MSINLNLPDQPTLSPRITVFGVGGAGGNAVNNMIRYGLEGVSFIVANTDYQALECSLVDPDKRIQLGVSLSKGLGAGSFPEMGKGAAEESVAEIISLIGDSNMLFITAGMGGGTGTGAAPVIAKIAKENKILTVGVVTKPFYFEGAHRMKVAELGLEELQKYVDTLIVIPNQNLFRIANEKTTFSDAFRLADNVLHTGVRGITDLMVMPGLINLDFADIRTVMGEMGKAMMGTGESEGEDRAITAAEAAISNPLLDNISMKGARGILINITGGLDMTLFEVDGAANRIREEVDSEANIIFGSTFDDKMEGRIRVSVLATGIDSEISPKSRMKKMPAPVTNNETPDNEGSASGSIDNFNSESRSGIDMFSYKAVDPEEHSRAINLHDTIKSHDSKLHRNLFGKVSDVIRNQKPPTTSTRKESDDRGVEWTGDPLDIPAFLRRNK